ncbi:MAG: hypothetical protein HY393_03380 [Candidatus Diapherotrites archaeon]|nr:hypothetical protein [Candidatus Diapherotrites archaeon]
MKHESSRRSASDLIYTIHSHFMDKLGYTGKKKERVRDGLAHNERLFIAQQELTTQGRISMKTYKSMLKVGIRDSRILMKKEPPFPKPFLEDLIRDAQRVINEIKRKRFPDNFFVTRTPATLAFARAAFRIHAYYLIALMGKKDAYWYRKNFNRVTRAIVWRFNV